MTVRMIYLVFLRLTGWMALLARSSASKDAELLVTLRRVYVLFVIGTRRVHVLGVTAQDRGDSTTRVTELATARIRRRKVLGGLIHEYERAA